MTSENYMDSLGAFDGQSDDDLLREWGAFRLEDEHGPRYMDVMEELNRRGYYDVGAEEDAR